nr:twin-arginine translocase subunit TatC [Maridesulfovibrio bastinii]
MSSSGREVRDGEEPVDETSNELPSETELNENLPASESSTGQQHEPEGESSDEEDEGAMTFLEHLQELRKRAVKILLACLVGFIACYSFSKPLFYLLMRPLVEVLPQNSTLIFTSLPEAFFTYLKVSFVAGVFVVSPYIFSQIWGFIAPGLYDHEKKWMIPLAFLSAFFFVGGALFGYYIVFPYGFEFFMGFTDEFIRPMPTLREYLAFSLKLLFAFGVIFELPLFIFFLSRLGIVTHKWLRAKRKYAILVCFIVSAILTPPDVVTQTLMAGPLIFLYELGIWVAYFFGKEKRVKTPPDDPDDPDNGSGPGSSNDSEELNDLESSDDANNLKKESASESSVDESEIDDSTDNSEESDEKKKKKSSDSDKAANESGYDEDLIEM